MGYRAKTDRRRHIHARRKSLIQRARTGGGYEAADFRRRIIHPGQCRWEVGSLFARRKQRIVSTGNRWLWPFRINQQCNASACSPEKIAPCSGDNSRGRFAQAVSRTDSREVSLRGFSIFSRRKVTRFPPARSVFLLRAYRRTRTCCRQKGVKR